MLYISTSTYYKFHFVAMNSIDKQRHGSTTNGSELDVTIPNKNKQKSIIINRTSDKDFFSN